MSASPNGRTAELSYHVTKVTNPADPVGCLLLLIGLPMLAYSAYLLYLKHDLNGFFTTALVGIALIGLSALTPRLFGISQEDTKERMRLFIEKGRVQDAEAHSILERLRHGEATQSYWLFLRPFTLENELLVVSTQDDTLGPAPPVIRYPEERFHDPKRQPVDLFDNLQFGFSSVVTANFLAIGRRPHELHGTAGFVQTTNEQWQEDMLAMARSARLIICMPWDTPGVLWETGVLAGTMPGKTLFVMPPCYKPVESIRSAGPVPLPWFSTYPLDSVPDYEKRWNAGTRPLVDAGLEVPAYNWHGMMFGYTKGRDLFVLRVPVHRREFLRCHNHIATAFGRES